MKSLEFSKAIAQQMIYSILFTLQQQLVRSAMNLNLKHG